MEIPKRFLLIDDDPMNNRLCKMALSKVFNNPEVFDFIEPEAGIQFIEKEYTENPVTTVLFLDINMPSLTGWEVLDILEELCEKVKDHLTIYILSSSIDPLDKQKADDSPLVSGYLEKPLSQLRLQNLFNVNNA